MTWTKVNPAGTRSPKSSPKNKAYPTSQSTSIHLVPKKVELSKKKNTLSLGRWVLQNTPVYSSIVIMMKLIDIIQLNNQLILEAWSPSRDFLLMPSVPAVDRHFCQQTISADKPAGTCIIYIHCIHWRRRITGIECWMPLSISCCQWHRSSYHWSSLIIICYHRYSTDNERLSLDIDFDVGYIYNQSK